MKLSKHSAYLSLALAAYSCGGGGNTATATGGTAGGHAVVANPARTAGGEVLRSAATGEAVSVTAHQRFEAAARSMRQHDEANEGRGDWTAATCNDVAGEFERAANEQPNGRFPEAWFNRGLSFDRCNLRNDARTAFQRASQAARNGFCRARVQLAVYDFRDGHVDSARTAFSQAVHDDPNCVEAYTNLATIQREELSHDARILGLLENVQDPRNQAQLNEAFRDVVANIRAALARDDKFVPALNQLALTYLTLAGNDPRSQRLLLAGIVCSQAAQVAQQHRADMSPDVQSYVADVYNTWGLIDIRSGQIIHALDHFRRAFTLNPNMFEAWMNYGTINLSFRGYRDARDAFQHAIDLRDHENNCERGASGNAAALGTCYDAHIGFGVALRGLGSAQDAERQYVRAQAIDGNRPDSFYNLGLLYESYMGGNIPDLQRALGFLDQFLGKARGNTRYAEAVTRANQHARNLREAIQALQAAAALNAAAPAGGAPSAAAGDAGAGQAAPTSAPASGADAGAAPAATH